MVTFSSLNLCQPLLTALNEEGYETPTPIQGMAIPPVLAGSDVLGCAQTGTGKTAAFALPILHRLLQEPADKSRRGPALPRALVLSPTRELATQIGDSFATYGRHTGLFHTVIYGGVSQFHQVRALHRGVDVLVATPGRLIDLIDQRLVDLSAVKVFVLDEADRMLDMGFINPIRRIGGLVPKPRQTLMFSATMPKEIMSLADSLLTKPVKLAATPVATAAPLIEQQLYMLDKGAKQPLLHFLIQKNDVRRAVVFTRTKHGADKVCRKLNVAGISAIAIHGNKAQNQRQRALDGFRSGRSRVLVATDVAARGLDVDGISHVFNFDVPNEPEAYVHRIGRTGRAGATGIAIMFCARDEREYLRAIEKLTGQRVPNQQLPEGLPEVVAAIQSAEHASEEEGNHAPRERREGGRPQRPYGDRGHQGQRGGQRGGERGGERGHGHSGGGHRGQRDERGEQRSSHGSHSHGERSAHQGSSHHAPASHGSRGNEPKRVGLSSWKIKRNSR